MEHPYTLMIVEDEEMIRTAVAAFLKQKATESLRRKTGKRL